MRSFGFVALYVLCLTALLALMASCADSKGPDSPYGEITAELVWPSGSSAAALAPPNGPSRWLVPAGVVKIHAFVTADDITTPPETDISVHEGDSGTGKIDKVPVGDNRTLTVQGLDASGNVIYQGVTTGISVGRGETTDAGAIVMRLVVTLVSAGQLHTCALYAGGVACWGINTSGQTNVPALTAPTQVAAGGAHTCAVHASGVDCWGFAGNGATAVPALTNPTQVAAGGNHSCALHAGGVTCWGQNSLGQTDVSALSNPTQVSAPASTNYTCALDDTGVVCWGSGPTVVPALSNPTQVSAGYHACALDDSGVVCWGDNTAGQTDVPGLSNPTQVSAGYFHTCALDDTGVVCWGALGFDFGQTNAPTLSNPTQVSAGGQHTCALDDSGIVCWGDNKYGQSTPP